MKRLSLAEAKDILKIKGYEVEKDAEGYLVKGLGSETRVANGRELVKFTKQIKDFSEDDNKITELINRYYKEKNWDKKGDLFFTIDAMFQEKKETLSETVKRRVEFMLLMG